MREIIIYLFPYYGFIYIITTIYDIVIIKEYLTKFQNVLNYKPSAKDDIGTTKNKFTEAKKNFSDIFISHHFYFFLGLISIFWLVGGFYNSDIPFVFLAIGIVDYILPCFNILLPSFKKRIIYGLSIYSTILLLLIYVLYHYFL